MKSAAGPRTGCSAYIRMTAELLREIDRARAGDATGFECRYRLRHNDGTYRWMACRGAVVRIARGRATRLSGSERMSRWKWSPIGSPGCPIASLLIDRVTHSLDRARRHTAFHFAVLLIDVGRPPDPRSATCRGEQ